jgi:hypothetical protein
MKFGPPGRGDIRLSVGDRLTSWNKGYSRIDDCKSGKESDGNRAPAYALRILGQKKKAAQAKRPEGE